ncbi:Uma2 family endonuclease [Hyalangium rubrum]|uniref:Uma2 family endonuclease n=1 Tax=Hyalangium rubrum TaxID=3103134 RepID=A0ABU5H1X6_9BACT|nr:Uma2 family endonuclease [Hyalangium sp. s54d21]MDY7227434.1 Uma2 family endonuclease [Hyalangium sp. s54d21]
MRSRPPPNPDLTYTDLGALPSNLVGEMLGGELVTSSRPGTVQTLAATALLSTLGGPFMSGKGGPGGWVLLFAPELHLGGEMLVPDIAGWRRERLPELPDVTVMTLPPDWVCEVLSDETEALDRGSKMLTYAREQVEHVWLVNPDTRTLEVYRFEDACWSLLAVHEDAAKVRAEPFQTLKLELGSLWKR